MTKIINYIIDNIKNNELDDDEINTIGYKMTK